MAELSALEQEVGQLIIDSLGLEELTVADIEPEAPLFGEGLGLDSIDALELALAISRGYGVQIRSDDGNNAEIFASLRALSGYIDQHRTT
ncbi:phosphopantetheine-binding protein [Thiohalospira sp.]|uniref:phosphopantetheine-binding protein n=1 Tax=Thiohalospira sp. TaxID=3080549 RepID=UPI00397F0263